MDAVISIGGQSFVDGLVRILGPALQPLRAPMPLALPGLSNSFLSVRNIKPVFPSAQAGTIELDLQIDLTAEVLLVASVAAGTVNITLGNGTVTWPGTSGTVTEQMRAGTLVINQNSNAGTETGTIAGVNTVLTMALNQLSGSVSLPAPTNPTTLNVNQIVGSIQLPAGTGNLGLPLPAVVPVAVDFTRNADPMRDRPLRARVFLSPVVNSQGAAADTPINAGTGFGLVFDIGEATAQVDLDAAAVIALQTALSDAFNTLAGQLLQGLPALTQPATNLLNVVTNVTNAIPAAAKTMLEDAFRSLKARTGRLIFPRPAAGSSCDVGALPTDGKARITLVAGSPVLQIGLDRLPIPPPSPFPPFTPTATVDTGVTLTNIFVRDLLACLIEKFPNLSLPLLPPTFSPATTVTPVTATWPGVTLTLGPLAFTGTMTLTIAGTPAGPGLPPAGKTITLAFALAAAVGAPVVLGPALTATLAFALPIAFDLNELASITSLRLTAPAPPAFTLSMGAGLIAVFVALALALGLPAFAVPFPIVWPGFVALAVFVIAFPFIVTGIVGGLVATNVAQVLGGAHRLLKSPAALPPGIFEAFGNLVPTTMVIDDLDAAGVLRTPTSPWAVLPLVTQRRDQPPPPPEGGGEGKPPVSPSPKDTPITPVPGHGTTRAH
jgi:hypothetical protein